METNSNESSDYSKEPSGHGYWRWGTAVLGAALLGISAYSLAGLKAERNRTEQLSATNVALRSSLNGVQGQLKAVSDQLQAVSQEQEAEQEKARRAVRVAVRPKPVRVATPAPDPRWKQVQDKLTNQQQQIASTQQDLAATKSDVAGTRQDLASARDDFNKANQDLSGRLDSTRGELSGSIAKTHDELVALQKRGERDYFEFQLDKSKRFQKIGPLSLSLRKANVKHKYYDLTLMVDDQKIEKKHVDLFEPIVIALDGPQPVEVVVNQIGKNEVKGYVTSPKYKPAEIASAPRH
ncbi:MAG TPA: hypothetical protein VFW83_11365 [Bryobacteraceae bacterium]|nr:hypothetical protein [Bryobacteraceae bacterium]